MVPKSIKVSVQKYEHGQEEAATSVYSKGNDSENVSMRPAATHRRYDQQKALSVNMTRLHAHHNYDGYRFSLEQVISQANLEYAYSLIRRPEARLRRLLNQGSNESREASQAARLAASKGIQDLSFDLDQTYVESNLSPAFEYHGLQYQTMVTPSEPAELALSQRGREMPKHMQQPTRLLSADMKQSFLLST